MNVILLLVPLIATMFGVMYYYNSREFTELLLAQPIPRRHIFIGQYLGIAGSLSIILITTHIMSFVEEMADDIVFLLEGKIHFRGKKQNLMNQYQATNLEKAIANILEGKQDEIILDKKGNNQFLPTL